MMRKAFDTDQSKELIKLKRNRYTVAIATSMIHYKKQWEVTN